MFKSFTMEPETLFSERLAPELNFKVSRSGGPGGQHVNKVSSKVTLQFDLKSSKLLTEEEKAILLERLASKLTANGVLILVAQESRSQFENKQAAISKLNDVLAQAFVKRKVRRPTKPTKGSVKKRKEDKAKLSAKKKWRQSPE